MKDREIQEIENTLTATGAVPDTPALVGAIEMAERLIGHYAAALATAEELRACLQQQLRHRKECPHPRLSKLVVGLHRANHRRCLVCDDYVYIRPRESTE